MNKHCFISLSLFIAVFVYFSFENNFVLSQTFASNYDTSFANYGLFESSYFPKHETVKDFIILDDKSILCLITQVNPFGADTTDGMYLIKLDSSGNYINDFGLAGIAFKEIYGDLNYTNILLLDDKIIVSGTLIEDESSNYIFIAFDNEGNFDNDFGADGILKIDYPENTGLFSLNKTILFDSTIYCFGKYRPDTPEALPQIHISRLLLNGLPDTTFNSTGDLYIETYSEFYPGDLEIDSNERVIISYLTDEPDAMSCIICISPNGQPDLDFGDNGFLCFNSVEVLYWDLIEPNIPMCIDSENRIVFNLKSEKNYLLRLNPFGTIDSTFGENGFFELNFNDINMSNVSDIGINKLNDIYILGSDFIADSTDPYMFFAINQDGTEYASFENNYVYGFYPDYSKRTSKMIVLPDNRAFCSGYYLSNTNSEFFLFLMNTARTTWTYLNSETEIFSTSIYPNPADNYFIVELIGKPDISFTINILDVLGQQLYSTDIKNSKKYMVTRNNIAAGVYYVSINGENFSKTEKIIFR